MSNKTIIHFQSLIEESQKLTKRDKDILKKRIEGKTLEQIGKKYKISAERVRQKEETAILKFMKKIYQLFLFDRSD